MFNERVGPTPLFPLEGLLAEFVIDFNTFCVTMFINFSRPYATGFSRFRFLSSFLDQQESTPVMFQWK